MGTADDLVALSDFAWERLRNRMAGLMDAVPAPPVPGRARGLALSCVGGGSRGGFYASDTRRSFVLHILDELIHHGAEAALLRDLYGHRA
ncbi:hypothetical protein [Kutzneria kofuensis]|uniref:DinB family protein n=1 Tax=Kutzneria kofuensis TaxID=103725 RepID=A0A7W9NJG1_9PSEU|nr:hypothetical protein [Kutzneria kofuensis]MBB5894920.1 hypothetical protein [Kutzneria kofuensis]